MCFAKTATSGLLKVRPSVLCHSEFLRTAEQKLVPCNCSFDPRCYQLTDFHHEMSNEATAWGWDRDQGQISPLNDSWRSCSGTGLGTVPLMRSAIVLGRDLDSRKPRRCNGTSAKDGFRNAIGDFMSAVHVASVAQTPTVADRPQILDPLTSVFKLVKWELSSFQRDR